MLRVTSLKMLGGVSRTHIMDMIPFLPKTIAILLRCSGNPARVLDALMHTALSKVKTRITLSADTLQAGIFKVGTKKTSGTCSFELTFTR